MFEKQLFSMLVILLLKYANCIQEYAVDCRSNMFELKNVTGRDSVDSLQVTVAYKIDLDSKYGQSGYLFNDYVAKCLDVILFQVQTQGTNERFNETYKINENDNITNYLTQEFRNLKPFTTYEIQIGYRQKSPDNNQTLFQLAKTLTTCFGSPSDPTSISYRSLMNGSRVIEWKEPKVLNSPMLSYYYVLQKYYDESQERMSTVNSTHFYLSKTDIERNLSVRVQSVNDIQSYYAQYPSAYNCANRIERSLGNTAKVYLEPGIDYFSSSSRFRISNLLFVFNLFLIVL